MTELFDIIVDYPDSMPALLDLKVSRSLLASVHSLINTHHQECLTRVDERLALVKALRKL